MNKLNQKVLKLTTTKSQREGITTSCDLYATLSFGYFALATMMGFAIIYLIGLTYLMPKITHFGQFFLYYNTKQTAVLDVFATLATISNSMLSFLFGIHLLAKVIAFVVIGFLMLRDFIKEQIQKITLTIPKFNLKINLRSLPRISNPLCRKLTQTERDSLSQ